MLDCAKAGKVARGVGFLRPACAVGVTLALFATTATTPSSRADDAQRRRLHAMSLIGEPAYGPEFTHFKWVNPEAPKGGSIRMFAPGTFDTLNPFTIKGLPAVGLAAPQSLLYATLMSTSPD
ncbi:MAG TPA: hypothetical protein PK264_09510, partial [Hyphomicrobiaceae bacterium]|nr:hypothetical protein [Hyphomicrobiaceae bacterium]